MLAETRPLPLLLAAAAGAATLYTIQQWLRKAKREHVRGAKGGNSGAAATAAVGGNGPPPLRGPPPHPNWHPPQAQPTPWGAAGAGTMHTIDPAQLASDVLYPLCISAVVPRPIAFVSTQSSAGVGNLAPFSYFNIVAHSPPHVVIGFAASRLRPHGKKDTLVNILETGDFVVNIMSEWFIEAANYCCGNFDFGKDEMELSGLTPMPSVKVAPPRVAESAVHMECQLRHTYEVKDGSGAVTGTVVIGEVVMMHVHEGVAGRSPSGKLVVDVERYKPMSRLGGNTYARTTGLFDLPRPDRAASSTSPAAQQHPLVYTSTPA